MDAIGVAAGTFEAVSRSAGSASAFGGRLGGQEGALLDARGGPALQGSGPPRALDAIGAADSTPRGPPPAVREGDGVRVHAADGSQRAAQMVERVQRAQGALDRILLMAESGRSFSPAELLALQAITYRAGSELELAGKLVERATSAVKQTLQTQL